MVTRKYSCGLLSKIKYNGYLKPWFYLTQNLLQIIQIFWENIWHVRSMQSMILSYYHWTPFCKGTTFWKSAAATSILVQNAQLFLLEWQADPSGYDCKFTLFYSWVCLSQLTKERCQKVDFTSNGLSQRNLGSTHLVKITASFWCIICCISQFLRRSDW